MRSATQASICWHSESIVLSKKKLRGIQRLQIERKKEGKNHPELISRDNNGWQQTPTTNRFKAFSSIGETKRVCLEHLHFWEFFLEMANKLDCKESRQKWEWGHHTFWKEITGFDDLIPRAACNEWQGMREQLGMEKSGFASLPPMFILCQNEMKKLWYFHPWSVDSPGTRELFARSVYSNHNL